MSSIPQIILQHDQKQRRRRRSPARWLGLGCSTIISMALILACIASVGLYAYVTEDLPSIDILPALLDAPNGFYLQPSQIYDRTDRNLLVTLEASSRVFPFISSVNTDEVAMALAQPKVLNFAS